MSSTILIRSIFLVTEKNIRIYYNKAPVIIFGLLFPFFLFLSFFMGRELDLFLFFPGLLAMSLFFTSSSVGPLITPWEKQAGTYERLLSYPVTLNTIIVGDILAGMLFGMGINIIVTLAGLIYFSYQFQFFVFIAALLFGSFCFSTLGVLLASPAVKAPSQVMMFSSLIRFPLIFISGIFIPLNELGGAARTLSYISPVTYFVDLLNYSLTGQQHLPLLLNFCALMAFSTVFLCMANIFHRKNHLKGL